MRYLGLKSIKNLAPIFAAAVILLSAGWGSTVQAQRVWQAGRVTQDAWFERYNRIEIDGIKFVFVPEVTITLPEKQYRKVSGEEQTLLLSAFYAGRKVTYSAHGHRIFEIMLDE